MCIYNRILITFASCLSRPTFSEKICCFSEKGGKYIDQKMSEEARIYLHGAQVQISHAHLSQSFDSSLRTKGFT